MRKLIIGLFALAAMGLAIPSAALADAVVIHKHRGQVYNYAPPAHNKTVIIKHHDHY
jgi:hypothetical protein